VGGTAVGLNIVLYGILVGIIQIPYLVATVIIFVIGNAYGFAANRSWTFLQRDRPLSRLALYYATMLASLGANLLSMLILVDGLGIHYALASVLTSLWLAPVLYLTHSRLAFGQPAVSPRADLMLITNYFPEHGGGVEIVANEVSRRLADGWEIRWFASGPGADVGGGRVRREGIRSWNGIERRTGLPIPIPSLTGFFHVVAGARAARAVWIHDILYLANIVAAATALVGRKPLIVTVHIGAIPYRNPAVRVLMGGLLALVGGVILPRAQAVTFVSERIRAEYSTRWRLRDSHLIPNGVDSSVYRPASAAERRSSRAVLGLGEGRIALFVGRFVERKGLPLLQELARTMPATTWVFAGDGPLDPDRWRLTNVRVLRRSNPQLVARLYGAADLVVLPSIGEGFPLVVQEALASGTPVLVDPSTAAGYPGVERYVDCEPVVGASAAERWRSHVENLLNEPSGPSRRSERAAFARLHWSWDKAAETYREVLGSCIEHRLPAPAAIPARTE
jgi:glycosyltransferase involved in cell wall biosynthesis/putative flippase GtrA